MPWVVPLIPALITAGTAGTEIGLQASGAFTPSTSGTQAAALTQEQNQQKQQQEQQQQLFKRAAPDAQAQTGGALSDSSMSALIAELSGTPGSIGSAQQTIFGTTPGGLSSGGGG